MRLAEGVPVYENMIAESDVLSLCMECGGSGHIAHMTNLPGFTVCWVCSGMGVCTDEERLFWQ
jgi:hypothetical protein